MNIQLNDPEELNLLNLGKVYGITEVIVNGINLGLRWYGERIFPLKNALREGENTIVVKLTTTMGNYLKSLEDNEVAVRWVGNRPYYPQGMLGPVTLG